jgi:hypothetical protein
LLWNCREVGVVVRVVKVVVVRKDIESAEHLDSKLHIEIQYSLLPYNTYNHYNIYNLLINYLIHQYNTGKNKGNNVGYCYWQAPAH